MLTVRGKRLMKILLKNTLKFLLHKVILCQTFSFAFALRNMLAIDRKKGVVVTNGGV